MFWDICDIIFSFIFCRNCSSFQCNMPRHPSSRNSTFLGVNKIKFPPTVKVLKCLFFSEKVRTLNDPLKTAWLASLSHLESYVMGSRSFIYFKNSFSVGIELSHTHAVGFHYETYGQPISHSLLYTSLQFDGYSYEKMHNASLVRQDGLISALQATWSPCQKARAWCGCWWLVLRWAHLAFPTMPYAHIHCTFRRSLCWSR